ncbi:hypothetical protein ABD76_27280 [Paenibacillus dendritiformis]|nr:hypothetical protein [Paenibacillus dendritiformis]MBG9792522.1 hypothetical protein [Paenibacillus dendritiformis]MBG9792798.1 hypothetical protein [Paenibacillus dendritiformis]MBG9793740.1 hypothetical protein [Paenibacillus dendritiformis]MBG9793803.1 hypothetical protein [Paenibacillus dendritiformis]
MGKEQANEGKTGMSGQHLHGLIQLKTYGFHQWHLRGELKKYGNSSLFPYFTLPAAHFLTFL